jgi:poly-gamma-glutamate synthesis protein (capsule biosynthesis protein)
MHPHNIGCLAAVRPHACALANNHVLDFGNPGLADTVRVLAEAGIHGVGAGLDDRQAEQPVILDLRGGGRVVIVSVGSKSSGIPGGWAAGAGRPGVALLADFSNRTATAVAGRALAEKRQGDVAIVSVHWGSNWGYDIDAEQVEFAHRLIDEGIDVVHGHSSHHPRPVEMYHGKLILYGCGDTVDDYEGIGTYEAFRHELRLLYFASIDRRSGCLTQLRMAPMRMRRMRLEHLPDDDVEWLRVSVEQMSSRFETRVRQSPDGMLTIGGATPR